MKNYYILSENRNVELISRIEKNVRWQGITILILLLFLTYNYIEMHTFCTDSICDSTFVAFRKHVIIHIVSSYMWNSHCNIRAIDFTYPLNLTWKKMREKAG